MVAEIYGFEAERSFWYSSTGLLSLGFKKLLANYLDFLPQILTYRDLPYIKLKEIQSGFQGAFQI